jgi:hypothetical protein
MAQQRERRANRPEADGAGHWDEVVKRGVKRVQ